MKCVTWSSVSCVNKISQQNMWQQFQHIIHVANQWEFGTYNDKQHIQFERRLCLALHRTFWTRQFRHHAGSRLCPAELTVTTQSTHQATTTTSTSTQGTGKTSVWHTGAVLTGLPSCCYQTLSTNKPQKLNSPSWQLNDSCHASLLHHSGCRQ